MNKKDLIHKLDLSRNLKIKQVEQLLNIIGDIKLNNYLTEEQTTVLSNLIEELNKSIIDSNNFMNEILSIIKK